MPLGMIVINVQMSAAIMFIKCCYSEYWHAETLFRVSKGLAPSRCWNYFSGRAEVGVQLPWVDARRLVFVGRAKARPVVNVVHILQS